jgi:hypothetical protein
MLVRAVSRAPCWLSRARRDNNFTPDSEEELRAAWLATGRRPGNLNCLA